MVENYRSHPALVDLPSQLFYDAELVVAAEKSLVECLCSWDQLPNRNGFPVLFHGVRVRYSETVLNHRAFSVAGPMVWNSLPDFLCDTSLPEDTFRRSLKTYFFALY